MATYAPPANGSSPTSTFIDPSSGREDPLPNMLGWGSLGLGIPQTTMPGRFDAAIGIEADAKSRFWTLVVGVREYAAAAGILALERPRPVTWLWARVGGDVMDLTLLLSAWRNKRADSFRLAAAIGAVLGIGAADVIAALRFTRSQDLKMEEPVMPVEAAITVSAPRSEVYAFWHDFQNFPRFMAHVESVEARDGGRAHWKASAPFGSVEWDAEIIDDQPGEMISWRSLPGSGVDNAGSVRFADAPGDRGTEIHVHLNYASPAGRAGALVAKLLGEEPKVQVKDDLRRFKQVMEIGEVVRSDGTPEGQMARRLAKQRPAHPPEEPVAAGRSSS
jgi:uncharacterized membrane protein